MKNRCDIYAFPFHSGYGWFSFHNLSYNTTRGNCFKNIDQFVHKHCSVVLKLFINHAKEPSFFTDVVEERAAHDLYVSYRSDKIKKQSHIEFIMYSDVYMNQNLVKVMGVVVPIESYKKLLRLCSYSKKPLKHPPKWYLEPDCIDVHDFVWQDEFDTY